MKLPFHFSIVLPSPVVTRNRSSRTLKFKQAEILIKSPRCSQTHVELQACGILEERLLGNCSSASLLWKPQGRETSSCAGSQGHPKLGQPDECGEADFGSPPGPSLSSVTWVRLSMSLSWWPHSWNRPKCHPLRWCENSQEGGQGLAHTLGSGHMA